LAGAAGSAEMPPATWKLGWWWWGWEQSEALQRGGWVPLPPPRGQVRGAGATERPPYLHADLGQVDLHGQLLAAVDVGVVGLLEGALQLVELVGGEGGAVPPVLLLGLLLLGGGRRGALAVPRLP